MYTLERQVEETGEGLPRAVWAGDASWVWTAVWAQESLTCSAEEGEAVFVGDCKVFKNNSKVSIFSIQEADDAQGDEKSLTLQDSKPAAN